MRNKISAIIIDANKNQHEYSKIIFDNDAVYGFIYGEKYFDICVLTSAEKILTEINKFKGVDCIITLDGIKDSDFIELNKLSFEYRKKWIHMKEFDPVLIARNIISVFLNNINRPNTGSPLFSIFTCTFNTPKEYFERLYNSLKSQTYHNWNWFILDDSTNPTISERIEKIHDPRIFLFKNITNHGNIGFNKHMIAMMCNGDYLVEVDHDDELTSNCLEYLMKSFEKYPDAVFAYSHAYEEIDGRSAYYSDGFAYGLGTYKDFDVNGKIFNIPTTADINAISVRGIHALPNHVRCWKKDFYHTIGGHNVELSVLDDMDILIRTFLNGKMIKIDKVLYIQHQGQHTNSTLRGTDTTQSVRFLEIQRCNTLLKQKYDKQIHERLIELCGSDPIWVTTETGGYSVPMRNNLANDYKDKLITLNYIFED